MAALHQVLLGLLLLLQYVSSEVLTPPYFNLAEKRRITASATCGEDVSHTELYCKLIGANYHRDSNYNLIQGQVCDICDPNNPLKWHPPEYAIDGSEKWWMSPPLSRGMRYNQVNLTVDLGQLFQVAYVLIKMGNSPRPGVWVLERSTDNGLTYRAWQYFADSPNDCENFFGADTLKPIMADDDVNCITHFSKVVPLEGGEIVVSLLNDRPSAKNFFNSTVLQEFTRATNVRLRFLRTKTLLGHLMYVARQDPTVTRRYFYSVKDISIGGRCVCNGHAGVCDITDPDDPYKLQCRCQHNTCGTLCESCCPDFIQKRWRSSSFSDAFVCERCNCHGHSEECVFDELVDAQNKSLDLYGEYAGGGVCQNCRDNTEGINCENCRSTFFRPTYKLETDVDACHPCNCHEASHTGNCFDGMGQCECKIEFMPPYCDDCNFGYYDYPQCKPCDCHREGTKGGICQVGGGQCPCEDNYKGQNCDQCKSTFYGFPECMACNCSDIGSTSPICRAETGQCNCISSFGGQTCDRCEHGYFNHPDCDFCNCDSSGTVDEICDKDTGKCLCKEGYSGIRCDNSAPGFWGYPLIRSCECHGVGSVDAICNADGYCRCFRGYSGQKCDQCQVGFYEFPECEQCMCERSGSTGDSCDEHGNCYCKHNFAGQRCEKCQEGFYIFPRCEECNCNPSGVIESFGGCDKAPVGSLCVCKPRVRGRICDQCENLYWNLQQYNPDGCEECSCNPAGTIVGLATCKSDDGQCICKPRVNERRCSECKDGSFNLLEDNLFGCMDCGCNRGGSLDSVCNKMNGACRCRPRVMGQRCDKPIELHYFPDLHHLKFEGEDGRTTYTEAVRFGYDKDQFPGYSWRGYAIFSDIQKETLYDVVIDKPSLYRLILSYRNPHDYALKGVVVITPQSPSYTQQERHISFPATPGGPRLMTVRQERSSVPLHLVMDPGHWTISITSDSDILLDYFVLLPSAYYEGTILTQNVTAPCMASGGGSSLCVQYAYPNIQDRFPYAWGSSAYVIGYNGGQEPVETYDDEQVILRLDSNAMAWLRESQPKAHLSFRIFQQGTHVILINYFTTPGAQTASVVVETSAGDGGVTTGRVVLSECLYAWTCRAVVMDLSGQVAKLLLDDDVVNIVLKLQNLDEEVAVESVSVVPVASWHPGLVTPQEVCVSEGEVCDKAQFSLSTDTTKVEFETNAEGKTAAWAPPGVDNDTVLVYLNETDAAVDISGTIRTAGDYVFIVHYYQPSLPEFIMQVKCQSEEMHMGHVTVGHCPAIAGCRTVITHDGGDNVFFIQDDFTLTINDPGPQEVWLDYLLAVPADQFNYDLLRPLPRDNTAEFIGRCGQNHFQLSPNTTGFCRDSAFAQTVDFNGGAVYCGCDYYGSYTIECEPFGGACPCKPNVIGRRCDRCKTGYFGFPNCQPCDCPSTALCDPRNGDCICPPLVYGDRCHRCVPNTYGFDSIIGCEECQCSAVGVRNGNLQCDRITGQCECLDNVIGRRCERCQAGYWTYPHCQICGCDIRGSEADICNQNDASCYCKANVEGRSCDICDTGSYNLEESNPDGCTRCFCFGKTSACSPSKFFWDKLYRMTGWSAVQLDLSGAVLSWSSLSEQPRHVNRQLVLNTSDFIEPRVEGAAYLAAPQQYLGNRITSYGGLFTYTLVYTTDGEDLSEDERGTGGEIVLHGSNITARYFHYARLTPSDYNTVTVRLNERNFQTLSGSQLTRDQFMVLLHKLEGMYVRAHYTATATETRLYDVTLDVATTKYYQGAEPTLAVEQCRCPVNYQGTSCEECAPGFFRAQTGPYGGFCVPCQCNRHSRSCNPVTGECLNCAHNTVGPHCERCARGFHGEATGQTPSDCLVCACPTPALSNNFADSCIVESGRPAICDCQPGYVGQQCQQCAPGHYGEPRVIGSYCQECRCNDNIDPLDTYSCDDISGRCLLCLNNTAGDACEVCEVGYYGDAITAKDCRPCRCNLCGTSECNHRTGVCGCQPNVMGELCDYCAPDHWGLDSCQGCQPCHCGIASVSSQCDLLTGDCECQPGVTGRYCDQCMPGYWNLLTSGCQECTCRAGFSIGVGCDPATGVCSCLPGVQGENCDGCPHRWVLVDGEGCHQCPPCLHALLGTADELDQLILPTINEFETAAHSFFLHQRLHVINDSAVEQRPLVDHLNLTLDNLRPVANILNHFGAAALLNNVNHALENSKMNNEGGGAVREEAEKVQALLLRAQALGHSVVREINALTLGLELGTGAQLDQAMSEGEAILARMHEVDLSDSKENAELELETARETLENIKNFSIPLMDQQMVVEDKATMLEDLVARTADIEDYIIASEERSDSAVVLNSNNRMYGVASLAGKLTQTATVGAGVKSTVADADNLTTIAQAYLEAISLVFGDLEAELGEVGAQKQILNASVSRLHNMLADVTSRADTAAGHTHELLDRAAQLDELLADTRSVSQIPLDAASASSNIVKAIDDARRVAEEAEEAGDKAVSLSAGVRNSSYATFDASQEKDQEAELLVTQVEEQLQPRFAQAQGTVQELNDVVEDVRSSLAGINMEQDQVEAERQRVDTEEETRMAQESRHKSDDAVRAILDVAARQEDDATTARTAFNNGAEARKGLDFATTEVNHLENDIPRIRNMAVELLETSGRVRDRSQDLSGRLARLRMNIQKTRELANKVRVGVDFQQDTTVEVIAPQDPSELATSTKFSLYVRTEQPSGLLLFLGTPEGGHQQIRRTKTDDFMALEIVDGFARLTMDLGSGPDSIENRLVYLSDGVWRKISVERTGLVVRLSVHFEDNQGTKKVEFVERVLPGRFSVLNLSPKVSRVFVGGIPSSVEVDRSIRSTSFHGQVEELVVNGRTVGMWNFLKNGTNNMHGHGAPERNRLVDLVPPTGLRFDGSGYAAMDTRGEISYHFTDKFDINLKFKTFSEDGIIFFIQESATEYLSLSMVGGFMVFQLNLGSGPATLRSRFAYNDGIWHRVEAAREQREAILKVDGAVSQGTTPGHSSFLRSVPDTMYFGGVPGEHSIRSITNQDFTGCIDEIVMSQFQLDLSQSTETIGAVPGCPSEIASLVSFDSGSPGHVQLGSPEGHGVKLVFKFRTAEPDGLLFYTASRDRSSYLTLALEDGSLILRAAPNGEISTGAFNRYNDSEWHVVIATREYNELRLDIDDYDAYHVNLADELIRFDGPVYFGGVPANIAPSGTVSYAGCIGDATLNGKVVDFSATDDRPNSHLQSCSLHRDASYRPELDTGPIVVGGPYVTPQPEAEAAPEYTDPPHQPQHTPRPDDTYGFYDEMTTSDDLPPLQQCALPSTPASATFSYSLEDGARFGNKRDSRIEISALPAGTRGTVKFSVELKTFAGEGVIFYSSSISHTDFIAIYMRAGKVVFSFNSLTTRVNVESRRSFRDNAWHTVVVEREAHRGNLYVDGALEGSQPGRINDRFMDHQPPYYLGGIRREVADIARRNMQFTDLSFNGCLRNLRMSNTRIEQVDQVFSVSHCSDHVEPGVFFGPGPRAHLILGSRFTVGHQFHLTMEVKPRVNNAVIMSIHGRRDFLMLQLRDGKPEFSADNGKGVIRTVIEVDNPYTYCDGRWHTFQVAKVKNLVVLTVDGVSNTNSGSIAATSTDTRHPLFLGSQPRLHQRRGQPVLDKFVGCIRNVTLEEDVVNLAYSTFIGNVNAGSCPTN